jgi:hypothetical protein
MRSSDKCYPENMVGLYVKNCPNYEKRDIRQIGQHGQDSHKTTTGLSPIERSEVKESSEVYEGEYKSISLWTFEKRATTSEEISEIVWKYAIGDLAKDWEMTTDILILEDERYIDRKILYDPKENKRKMFYVHRQENKIVKICVYAEVP